MATAKFRCMEISQFWNGMSTSVRFLPVMPKSEPGQDQYDEDGASLENRAFWEATPSGEATLLFVSHDPTGFELGKCYYIDMEPAENGKWELYERTQHESQLDIVLKKGWPNTVKMSINNQGAWPTFAGKVGASWSVVFRPESG